jgi:hypothetical protein
MILNNDTFFLYAAKNYMNNSCESVEEFENDLSRIRYIKRLLRKYKETGDLKERLILNHIIVLYNVFDNTACTNMLKYKLAKYLPELKPFLLYLSYWKDETDGIVMDVKIIRALRTI